MMLGISIMFSFALRVEKKKGGKGEEEHVLTFFFVLRETEMALCNFSFLKCQPCVALSLLDTGGIVCRCQCGLPSDWECNDTECALLNEYSTQSSSSHSAAQMWSDPWTFAALAFFLVLLCISCWRVLRRFIDFSVERRFE